ncbi:MAG: DegT/DnrJ/EryC1/StrS family aminotransferase [Chitinophagaceae bacterium]
MLPIHMVDTGRQYLKIKEQVDASMQEVVNSSVFIGGKTVQQFSENLAAYNGSKHVIPCANGTDALQIAMMALDLQPGDEVITPSFTYIATVEVIALLKLKPVFVEVEAKSFCIDPQAVEKAITPKTRAIVPVHLFGHAARMEHIMQIAAKHNLYVIEDNAQAIGSDYIFNDSTRKKTGSIGTIGCTSFYPSKNLGCFGDGGAIFTNDDALALKLKMIANHGQSKRYYHDIVGCNSRLDAIQAAVLNEKLKHLDEYITARRKAADYYDQAFADHAGIITPFRAAYCRHVFHQYTVLVEGHKRDELVKYLSENNIPSMIYYPVPAHKQKMFHAFGGSAYELPLTDSLTERVISLPMHTELANDQLNYITNKIVAFLTH